MKAAIIPTDSGRQSACSESASESDSAEETAEARHFFIFRVLNT